KPQLHSYPTSTRPMRPTRALPWQQGESPSPERGALTYLQGPTSRITGDRCRNIHRQGQGPLAPAVAPPHSILADQGIET
ncbi:unnamed protein product, partial [Tetraodon nigroviridis]